MDTIGTIMHSAAIDKIGYVRNMVHQNSESDFSLNISWPAELFLKSRSSSCTSSGTVSIFNLDKKGFLGKVSTPSAKSGKYFRNSLSSDCKCSLISTWVCALMPEGSNLKRFSK